MLFKDAIDEFTNWRTFKINGTTTRGNDKDLRLFSVFLRNPQIEDITLNNMMEYLNLMKEIERYGDFRSKVLGMTGDDKIRQSKLDIRGYMKYILEKGAIQEKRELMQSFTSKLILINKRVILE